MQDALSIVPKLREENAALLKEVAVLREKQNRSVQTRPTAYGGSVNGELHGNCSCI